MNDFEKLFKDAEKSPNYKAEQAFLFVGELIASQEAEIVRLKKEVESLKEINSTEAPIYNEVQCGEVTYLLPKNSLQEAMYGGLQYKCGDTNEWKECPTKPKDDEEDEACTVSPEWVPFKTWTATVLAIITNKVKWSWASNSLCKYINIRVDMRDGAASLSITDNNRNVHRIDNKLLTRQYEKGADRFRDIPTLEEQGIDCSNLKE